jgi:hypothetical protein
MCKDEEGNFLRPKKDAGRLQVTAAISLLEFSRLVPWNPAVTPVPRDELEARWTKDIVPVFGRLIC